MAWRKSPESLVALFDRVAPAAADRRQMFGYPACFVNGNLFASLFEDRFVLRLGERHRAQVMEQGGVVFAPMPARPMKEYVVVPPALVADEAALRRWVGRALEHVARLPAKAKGARKKRPPVTS